jgi:hypothetical protein
MPVPSLGPLQWSLRSPWMVAAIVGPSELAKLGAVTSAYVERWLELVQYGLGEDVDKAVAGHDVAGRDQLNRAAIFSPTANPVWILLERLVGRETARAMRTLLIET